MCWCYYLFWKPRGASYFFYRLIYAIALLHLLVAPLVILVVGAISKVIFVGETTCAVAYLTPSAEAVKTFRIAYHVYPAPKLR